MTHPVNTAPLALDDQRILALAHETLDIEADAVRQLRERLSSSFVQAVRAILAVRGRVVVMGMGKSGHIGRKITATLASTGTPAMFVHPAEASHGDLGMVKDIDLVIAISNSGESEELSAILPVLKRQGVPLIGITGGAQSTLARHADIVLDSAVSKEACPLNLAPTASTTAQMALGDALAVALLDARGFKAEDFARSHPGGSLGRRLLTHVSDVMRSGDAVPCVLRRLIEKGIDMRTLSAQQVMHTNPRTVRANALAAEAAELMELHRITSVLVVDEAGCLCGAVNSNDLMRAKVI